MEMWLHGTIVTRQVQGFPWPPQGTEANAGNWAPKPQGKPPNPAVCQHDSFSIYSLGSCSAIDNKKTMSVHPRKCTAFLRCGHDNTWLVFILTQVFSIKIQYVYTRKICNVRGRMKLPYHGLQLYYYTEKDSSNEKVKRFM